MHLECFADRLAGFHIHDVDASGKDHRPPGTGSVDWVALKPFVKPGLLKVFEFSPSITTEDVRSGTDFIKGVWGPE